MCKINMYSEYLKKQFAGNDDGKRATLFYRKTNDDLLLNNAVFRLLFTI